ncbi:putative Major facilitator superfamily (MFS) profile domain-containing protein [Seiridium cardinale]|uniref:Major facilitator superfamily (MFS) profile domain-containing protein n=1 Tax=Seiridium cardinale TaxID=138064 RepID=A0ABR2Y391_9PEZI
MDGQKNLDETQGLGENQDGKQDGKQDEKQYPPFKIVLPAMAAIWLTFFLIALDRTIIGTAIPSISQDFNSFGDIAWYEAGFLLPLCVLQLSFGLVYKYYSTKWVLISLVAVFEVGSVVCAAAPTSNALIVGRVITGVGGAGISVGTFLLITFLVPLESRPKYIGAIGSVFGITSAIGPILGGYLTSVTWRWCFWINLPIGIVSLILLVLLAPKTPPVERRADTWLGKAKQLDLLGFFLIAPAVICLLFALEWGGTKYPWSNGRIIALFVIFGVLGLSFVASQVWRQENATVPPRIFRNRSIFAGCFAYVGSGSALVIFSFYLPIWFQVVQDKSPQDSGISLLPLLISIVVTVIGSGIATSAIGYYTPLMIIGSALLVVGSALSTLRQPDISTGASVGYQIVTGIGFGLGLQQPNVAAQTVMSNNDISIALSLLNFVNFLGSTIFITTSQTLLEGELVRGLGGIIPNLDASTLANGGASSLRSMVPADMLPVVLDVYNNSIRSIWYLALALACLSFVASLGMEWKSVKAKKDGTDKKEETTAVAV